MRGDPRRRGTGPVTPPPDRSCSPRTPTIAAGQSVQVLGDSVYGTGSMLAALAEAGHQALVKPGPINPAVAGDFTVDDFTVDHCRRSSKTGPVALFEKWTT